MQDDRDSMTSENPVVTYKDAGIVRAWQFRCCRFDLEERGHQARNETSSRRLAIEQDPTVDRVFLGDNYCIQTQKSVI